MSTNQSSDQDQSQSAGRGGSESEYMPLQNSKIDSFGTVYGVCVVYDNVLDFLLIRDFLVRTIMANCNYGMKSCHRIVRLGVVTRSS